MKGDSGLTSLRSWEGAGRADRVSFHVRSSPVCEGASSPPDNLWSSVRGVRVSGFTGTLRFPYTPARADSSPDPSAGCEKPDASCPHHRPAVPPNPPFVPLLLKVGKPPMFPRGAYSAAVKPPLGLWAPSAVHRGAPRLSIPAGTHLYLPLSNTELWTLGLQLPHHTAPGHSSFLLKGQKQGT